MHALTRIHFSSAVVPPWSLYTARQRAGFLVILFLVSTSNYFDRYLIAILLEPIRTEFQVSDTMLGLLGGFCFALFYGVAGMPVARWADRGNRRTVITLALTVWSVMTVFCGLAQTFWQLVLARVGVGAGESGAIPPAQSLIADYFSPKRRTIALSIFTAGATAGYLLGFVLGGSIAATHGWRSAFLLAGAPGLVLAVAVRFTLAEPRLQRGFPTERLSTENFGKTFATLWRKRSFRYALAGSLSYFLYAYGPSIFIPSFLMRVQHASLAEVSMTYGTVTAVGSVIGTLGGGWLADRFGQRDIRWLAWLPAIACGLSAPLFVLAFAVSDFGSSMALIFGAHLLVVAGMPPVFAAIHAVCGSPRRATAIALVLFSATLFGGGLGPLATGTLSDALSLVFGAEGLRYSLMATTTVLIAAAVGFYKFGCAMPHDLEE